MSDVIVAPETRDLAELAGKLRAWLAPKLALQFPGAANVDIVDLTYPRGAGQSHETILFDATWTEGSAARRAGYVVRIKPASFTVYPDNLFEEQYLVMKALAEDGRVKVPAPLWLEEDPAVLGKPFFVMEKREGRVPVSIPHYSKVGFVHDATPAQRRHMWESAVRQLAAIQLVPLDGLEFLSRPPQEGRGFQQEWDKYVRFIAWLRAENPEVGKVYGPILEGGLDRLKSLWPKNRPDGLVWGDSRMGNMMFDENFDVVAVLDWEQPSLGGALHDLAWFSVISDTMHGPNTRVGQYLEGMGTRDELIALWEEVSGKSAAELEWYEEFAHLKMSCTGVRLGQLRGTFMMDAPTMARRLKIA
ncbi:MAG: phosphotransferase family protein [Novosphingobium sp.]